LTPVCKWTLTGGPILQRSVYTSDNAEHTVNIAKDDNPNVIKYIAEQIDTCVNGT